MALLERNQANAVPARSVQNSTRLELPADRAFDLFRAEASEHDLPIRSGEGSLTVLFPTLGEMSVEAGTAGVRLVLNAATRAALQALQEIAEYHLDEAGLAKGLRWSLAEAGARPANMTIATVVGSERISPSFRRVRLSAPDIARFGSDGLHFRLLFAPPEHSGEWPTVAEDGRTTWPGGMQSWHRPVYTIRRIDPEAGWFDFDVFLHEGGRTTEWCLSVAPGSEIGLTGPGGGWYPEERSLALFGDETALPAIARILEAQPEDATGIAVLMVDDEDHAQHLARPAGIALRWLFRRDGASLFDELRKAEMPLSGRFVWFAAEMSEADEARDWLRSQGLAKGGMRVAGYWKR